MEENALVYFGSQTVGKVQILRQGLYYRFICRCQVSGGVIFRLFVRCGDHQESLGVIVPQGDGFGLDTRLPVKRLGEGTMHFSLHPRSEQTDAERFVPIIPEEPFAYISRLKESFLVRRADKLGILLKDSQDSISG